MLRGGGQEWGRVDFFAKNVPFACRVREDVPVFVRMWRTLSLVMVLNGCDVFTKLKCCPRDVQLVIFIHVSTSGGTNGHMLIDCLAYIIWQKSFQGYSKTEVVY